MPTDEWTTVPSRGVDTLGDAVGTDAESPRQPAASDRTGR